MPAMTVTAAFRALGSHTFRVLSNDPYDRRKGTVRFCVMCHQEWPCKTRGEAQATIRLADQMLLQARSAALS